jgi:type IV secretion system protein VirD4
MLWIIYGGLAFFIGVMILSAFLWGNNSNTTYGSARWASALTAFRKGLFREKGLLAGDWTGQLGVFYDGAHAITFGVSGSGKGTAAVLPNLLSCPYIFLIDPGGENTAVAAKCWRERGYAFGCLNVFGMHPDAPWSLPDHGFNPLDFLNQHSRTFAADSLVFAEMLTPRTGGESNSSAYFKDAAQTAKRAMIVHIKTTEPRERQNLETLYRYVNRDAAGWEALLRAMKANPVCVGLVAQEATKLERIETQAPEEFSAIMSTIQQDLSFLADPLVREKLSRSDVNFEILKGGGQNQRGGIVSVIIPLEYMESHAAIARLAMACAVLELQRKPLPQKKVVFLIDEAAALGKILRFPNWLATLRKYRVSLWSIWQNLGQVVHLYDKNAQTIISNCALLQILGVGDLETAEYTQKYLGQSTVGTITTSGNGQVSRSFTGRPLVMADELLRLDSDKQIVFIGNLHPMTLVKTPYWKRLTLQGTYYANPYYSGRAPRAGLLEEIRASWGSAYYALLWWAAPHPVAACIIVAAVALAIYVFGGGGG